MKGYEMRWSSGEYVREEVYPVLQGAELYYAKGKPVSFNCRDFNQLKLDLRNFENHFNDRRCENFDMIGTYRPYHFNGEDFGLYIYAEMFGMYLLSIIKYAQLGLREAHTLALDTVLTHGAFHYLVERYCILLSDVAKGEEGLYPIYKRKIYSQTWGTQACLEELLANVFLFYAYPLWSTEQKEFIRNLFLRQREGYKQAQALSVEEYQKLFAQFEEQLQCIRKELKHQSNTQTKVQTKASTKAPTKASSKENPSLYDFIHRNIPFRYFGLPVYLVNDCKSKETFQRLVEVLFPRL